MAFKATQYRLSFAVARGRIPLLSGPGTITTILLLTNQQDTEVLRAGVLVAIVAIVYLIAWFLLYAAERIMTRLGEGKVRIMTRVLAPESPSPNYPAAAVRGLPVKLVFISSSKPPGISRHQRARVDRSTL